MKQRAEVNTEARGAGLAAAMCELGTAAEEQGWPLPAGAAGTLAQWAQLVVRWRARAGLTAARTAEAVVRDLMVPAVYALRVVASARTTRVVDLGCGSGCTGVTLALAVARGQWDLVDRSETKITFCRYGLNRCGIAGASAHTRGEALASGLRASVVLARALPRTRDTLRDVDLFAEPGAILVRWVDMHRDHTRGETIRCGSRKLWVVVDSVESFT